MNLESQERSGKGRMDAHNQAYAARFGIPAEQIPYAPLNPEWFATRIEEPWEREIAPGVTMSAYTLNLDVENYTNVYDVLVSPDSNAQIELLSFPGPKKPAHIFRDTPDLIALTNGTFFFFIDDMDEIAQRGPKEGTLNWCTRDGVVFGLPSTDRPALFEINGTLEGKDVKARGEVVINDQTISWVGGRKIMHAPKEEWPLLYNPEEVSLFNAGCVSVTKSGRPGFAMRMLEKETYFTPQHPDVVALAVSLDDEGVLKVAGITEGGGMGVFDGHFILQMPRRLFDTLSVTVGSQVTPKTLDGIDLSKVTSALTVGPSVFDYKTRSTEREIDTDRSLGLPPPFSEDKRYARTIVMKDASGVHIRMYDAVSPSTRFAGISPIEVAEHLEDGVEWAFFCDGGQTAVIGVEDSDGEPEFFGNAHYATHKRASLVARMEGNPSPEGSVLLGRPRPLPSAVGIRYRRDTV